LFPGERFIGFFGSLHGLVFEQGHEGIDFRVILLNPLEHTRSKFSGRDGARTDRLGCLLCCTEVRIKFGT
jgi:hypothetical protein